MQKAPIWTGVVIGVLLGMVLGGAWLLGREAGRDAGPAATGAGRDTVIVREVPVTQPVVDDPVTEGRANALVTATQLVAPAVVSINSIDHRVQSVALVPRGMEYWERFYPGMFPRRELRRDVSSLGSGVIVSADGFVLTNHHVVENADSLIITLHNGRQHTGAVVADVPAWDLALIQLEGVTDELPFARIHEHTDDLSIGAWVIAIGSPFGYLLADTQPTVTVGVISALNRDIKQQRGAQTTFLGMIQTDAAINPGNSGGPLVNAQGEVIGINTFILSGTGNSIGLGFAVPIERASWIIRDVREHGRYRRPYAGIGWQPLSPQIVRSLGLSDATGFILREVAAGSPADEAGLRIYDVVRRINGIELTDKGTVDRLIYEAKVGTSLIFTVEREGERFDRELTLREAPRQ